MYETERYAVRAKFVDGAPLRLKRLAQEDAIYLGKRGQWASLENALTFTSRIKADAALQEKWNMLRNAGDKSVILSVVDV